MIEINANGTGVGTALNQPYEEVLISFSYASRTTNVHERGYSTTEREGLAVV